MSGGSLYHVKSQNAENYTPVEIYKNHQLINTLGSEDWSSNQHIISSLFVQGGNIHAVGEYEKEPFYLKNDDLEILLSTAENQYAVARSIFVGDNTVLIASYDGTEAKLRIDSSQGYLTVMSRANDIGVPGNETFVAGIGKNVSPLPSMFTYARLYVGGTVINLSHGASDATANAVFVMDK